MTLLKDWKAGGRQAALETWSIFAKKGQEKKKSKIVLPTGKFTLHEALRAIDTLIEEGLVNHSATHNKNNFSNVEEVHEMAKAFNIVISNADLLKFYLKFGRADLHPKRESVETIQSLRMALRGVEDLEDHYHGHKLKGSYIELVSSAEAWVNTKTGVVSSLGDFKLHDGIASFLDEWIRYIVK